MIAGETTPAFGAALRRLRLTAGLSQELLAERAQVSVESISALERGFRRAPYRSTVDLLATGLGLAASDRAEFAAVAAAQRGRGPRATPAAAPEWLPAYTTTFIDRARELRELGDLLGRSRMLTICGPGGVGKTRLAVELAARAAGSRSSNGRFVDIATLRDPAHVVARIASALDPGAVDSLPDMSAVVRSLARSDLLLVFDNCEHLVDACAHAIEAILRGCPRIRIIATSREPLLIDGETLYRLDPFGDLAPAIALFIDRARAAADDFVAAGDVTETIARHLGGIPLAIELAAALARTQSATNIARMLSGAQFLSGAARRTSIEHQRTMEATLAWSYALLSENERSLLRRLAYPAGGTAIDAIATIYDTHALVHVQRLIDTSLIVEDAAGGRVKLHPMTRQFVASVTPLHEVHEIACSYARWLGARMQENFAIGWHTASYDVYGPLAAELDNVRQALQWSIVEVERDVALDLVSAPDYWTAIGRPPEGYRWLTDVAESIGGDAADPREATLWFGIALCAAQSGLARQTSEPGRRASEIAHRHGVTVIEARAAVARANALLAIGDAAAAAASHARAIALFESIQDTTGRARAMSFRALALIELDAVDEAAVAIAGVIRIHTDVTGPVGASDALLVELLLGEIARFRADVDTMLDRMREAASLLGEGHRTWIHIRAVHGFVDALMSAREPGQALAIALPELKRLHERGFATDVALLIERIALIFLARGHVETAAHGAGFAEHTLAAAGRQRMRADRLVRSTLHNGLQAALDADRLAALQAAGAELDPDAFVELIVTQGQMLLVPAIP